MFKKVISGQYDKFYNFIYVNYFKNDNQTQA